MFNANVEAQEINSISINICLHRVKEAKKENRALIPFYLSHELSHKMWSEFKMKPELVWFFFAPDRESGRENFINRMIMQQFFFRFVYLMYWSFEIT